eukprot:8090235-Pyramimonas_sp.AAC.2
MKPLFFFWYSFVHLYSSIHFDSGVLCASPLPLPAQDTATQKQVVTIRLQIESLTRLWNRFTPQTVPSLSCEVGVLALAFDHSRVLAGCEDSRLRVWDFGVSEVAEGSFADKDAWHRLSTSVESQRARRDLASAMGRTAA